MTPVDRQAKLIRLQHELTVIDGRMRLMAGRRAKYPANHPEYIRLEALVVQDERKYRATRRRIAQLLEPVSEVDKETGEIRA